METLLTGDEWDCKWCGELLSSGAKGCFTDNKKIEKSMSLLCRGICHRVGKQSVLIWAFRQYTAMLCQKISFTELYFPLLTQLSH